MTSPAYSFGSPSFAQTRSATAAAGPAESAVQPSGGDASPLAPSRTAPSEPAPSGPVRSGTAAFGASVAERRACAGRTAGRVPGRVRVGDARPAAQLAVVSGPDVPAVRDDREGLRRAHGDPFLAFLAFRLPASPGKAEAATAAAAGQAAATEGPVTMRNAPRKGKSKRSARQAHLTVARVEPWSVMKFSFVVSLVAFVILFVAVSVLYSVLSGLGVFDSLQRVVTSVTSSQTSAGVNAKAWFSASKVLGYTALLGSLNIVLITAMCTIGSVVYNLTSRLVGGVEVTLRETE